MSQGRGSSGDGRGRGQGPGRMGSSKVVDIVSVVGVDTGSNTGRGSLVTKRSAPSAARI